MMLNTVGRPSASLADEASGKRKRPDELNNESPTAEKRKPSESGPEKRNRVQSVVTVLETVGPR